MSALQILPHYNFEDWQLWEGKWEIIHGIPYAMSPAPVPKHQIIANALGAEFHFELKKCKDCKAMQPVDYKVGDDTVVQPDLLIVCEPIAKPYLDFAPVLIAEILSPSTALKDTHTKYQIYEQQKIKYYLIISPDKEEVEVFENSDKGFQRINAGSSFTHQFIFSEECVVDIDFKEIWK